MIDQITLTDRRSSLLLAAEVTVAWLTNSNTRAGADDVPAFLTRMVEVVTALGQDGSRVVQTEQQPQEHTPAVSVRKSLANPDHILSMIDGKPYKTLRRHLAINGLTPEQYRERFGLKPDYPMVARNYSEARRAMAKRAGLGRKPIAGSAQAQSDDGSTTSVSKRSRGKKADA